MKGDSAHHYLLYVKKVKLGNGIVTSWWSRASLRGLHLNRDLEDVKDGSLKNAVDEDQGRADSAKSLHYRSRDGRKTKTMKQYGHLIEWWKVRLER